MTTYQPIAACYPVATAVKPGRRVFVALAGLAMATGTVVLVEPAPYDFAFILLLAAALVLNRLTFNASQKVPILLLFSFAVANLFSMLNARDITVANGYNAVSAYLILTWIFFVGFSGYYGIRGVKSLLRGYMIAGWAIAALSTLAFFRLIPYSNLFIRMDRASGLFKDPNVYGPYVVSVLVFSVAALERYRITGVRFALGLAACVLTGVGIFLSFSRAAWINAAISIVFMLGLQLLYGLLKQRIPAGLLHLLFAIGLAVLAGGLIGSALPRSTLRLLTVRLGTQGLQNYDRDRFDTQRRAVEAVQKQPSGIGAGQSEVVFNYSTHSMYLRILAEAGVFGFIAFYAFIGLSFVRAIQMALTLRDEVTRGIFAALSACMLGTFINGLVIDTIHWRHLWFLLGLAWWSPGPAERSGEASEGY